MARRHRAEKRIPTADAMYDSILVAQFVNQIMRRGKKTTAQRIVYDAFNTVKDKLPEKEPIDVFNKALDNIRPSVEVKSRRVGGATYQVPVEVNTERGRSLAMRWLIQYAKSRKGVSMSQALSIELLDAFNNTGNAIKKRDDTHKMAQANRAFAHYRW